MPDSLLEAVQRAKQHIIDITDNYILNCFNEEKCRQLDSRTSTDAFVRRKVKVCIACLSRTGITHTSHYEEAFNAYNEMVVFDLLSLRTNICAIAEHTHPTPDYVVTTRSGHRVNVDLKTLSFTDGSVHLRQLQEQYTDSKIAIEEQINKGATGAVFGTPVHVSPWKKTGRDSVSRNN
ncbi:MAG TPA: hypothetical protein VEY06_14875 [Flavisolibacter sp.]|nr:hypothetical protein [Flavisolibacter sp.]